MNKRSLQRSNGLILSSAYCLTALLWSVAIIGSAYAQDGLPRDKFIHSAGLAPTFTLAIPIPHAGELNKKMVVRTVQHFQHPTQTSSKNRGIIHDQLGSDHGWDLRVASPFLKFVIHKPAITASWPVLRPLYKERHAKQDTIQTILTSTGRDYAMMPLEVNRHVKRILDYYQHDIHSRFQKSLDRFEKYKNLVQRTFKENGLPPELGFLSLVESGFNTRAISSASASGPWQFMKATGRVYGLDVTWYVDERRDPVKSTVAAAQHLKDLFDEFKSWPLALAAYNAGGSKINRAIRKSGSRDYWKIRKTGYILRETKDYVPSFIAVVLIASNPTKYGFKRNRALPYTFVKALVRKRAHLKAVAEATGVSLRDLAELNPELRQDIIPIVEGGYSLKVPQGKALLVRGQHDQIKLWPKLPPVSATWYRVRFGDTIDDVAQRFGLTKLELKRLNNLKENRIRWNDRLRLRTDDDSAPIALEAEPPPLPITWYRVRFGDSLASVAKEFGLSVQELKRLNNLKENRIRWNDRLRVRAEEDDDPSLLPKTEPLPPTTWYRVHFGDTLASVAKEFGLSVRELKRLNNLEENRIRWNDRLRVRAEEGERPLLLSKSKSSSSTTWYRIHYGDTLSSIANEFGLSVSELKRLNNLKKDHIRTNDRLRVRAADNGNPSVSLNPEKDKS
ncbi:MAG: LysM peptidoglycan-binding domain-containing protein [Nitrospirales bacterium]